MSRINSTGSSQWQSAFFLLLFSMIVSSCASTSHQITNQTFHLLSYLAVDDPTLAASVLIVGRDDEAFTVCNGVYLGKRRVATAGHCLNTLGDFDVFIAVNVTSEAPFSRVRLQAVPAKLSHIHPKFKIDQRQGRIAYDYAELLLEKEPPDVVKAAPRQSAEQSDLGPPATLSWQQQTASFSATPKNTMKLTGFRIEKEGPQNGFFLLADAVSFAGVMSEIHGLMLTTNPGTNIHRGVSGSGVYQSIGGRDYFVGIASHHIPEVGIVVATDARDL